MLELTLVRHPGGRAGFFFTLQTLSRSLPHRVSLATALAVGLAIATVTLRRIDAGATGIDAMPLSFLALQTTLLGLLIAGLRHALRVPAELRASWTFHVCWPGDDRPYIAGVKRATLVAFVIPLLFALLPLHGALIGWQSASVHFAYGLVAAVMMVDASLLGVRKLPMTASYVPDVNVKTAGPIVVVAFLLGAHALAWLERVALHTSAGSVMLLLGMMIAALVIRAVDWRQRRLPVPIELGDAPASGVQKICFTD
jgi:hypothetical protein